MTDNDIIVQKSRPGLGYGLFAARLFQNGEFVIEYRGVRIPTAYADALKTRYLFEIDEQWTIDGSSRRNLARYINHSCVPNCEAALRGGRILIFAARRINCGEELTIDYGDEYFDEFIRPTGCRCVRCTMRAGAFIFSEGVS